MLGWFRKRIAARLSNSMRFQQEIDTFRVASNLMYYQNFKDADLQDFDVNYKTAKALAEKMSFSSQRHFIDEKFDSELERLFEFVHKQGGVDPYPAPIVPCVENEVDLSYEELAERNLDIISESEARKQEAAIRDKPIDHPDGFQLQIKYSDIDHPAAGFGVFVKGTIIPGTIVGLYPGVVYFRDSFPQLKVRFVIPYSLHLHHYR
jgi:hypothetical protein